MIAAAVFVESSSPSLADEIARLAAQIDAVTHRLLTCIRTFDESGEWHSQGAQSCAHWLSWRIGLDLGTAREQVRVARALGRLPAINAALSRAELSYSKARAITRVATPDIEQRLLAYAAETTGAQLERICRRFRRVRRDIDGVQANGDQRGVSVRPLSDGLVRVELTLHPDEAELVVKAIEKARDHLRAAADTRPASQDISAEAPSTSSRRTDRRCLPSRADAVVHLAEQALADTPNASPSRGSDNYQVFVHLDQSLLAPDGHLDAFLEDGTRISADAFRRVTCDGALVGVATSADRDTPLDVGRRRRTIPPPIRRALFVRDRGCRWPGCTNRRFVHGHHIRHWANGGATSLANLVTLCTFHHGLVHEGGFRIAREVDGELHFVSPRSPLRIQVPRSDRPAPLDDNAEMDVGPCNWTGEPIDYEAALDALLSPPPAVEQPGRLLPLPF